MNILSKHTFIIAAAAAVAFTSCKSLTPEEQLMQTYLANELNDPSLELTEAKFGTTTAAADSLAIIQPLFEAERDTAIAQQERAYAHSKKAHEIATEGLANNDFPMLDAEFESTIATSEAQMEVISNNIKVLKSDCKGYKMESQYNRVKRYKEMGDGVLHHSYNCTYNSGGSTGNATVYLNGDKTKVLRHEAGS